MPLIHPDDMQDEVLSPLMVAGNPSEAQEAETILDASGHDYTVEITGYVGGFFSGVKQGVMFLVREAELEACQGVIRDAGKGKMLID